MTLYPYRELTITSKVQDCCGREFAAKLGEFDYSENLKGKLLRWADNVKRDLGKLPVDKPGGWWDVAQDRDRWRLLIEVAKSHMGLQPVE